MANLGEFASLLQLGVGVGIGLSVFRAPIDLRIKRINGDFEGEMHALKGAEGEFAKEKFRELATLRLLFEGRRVASQKWQLPFMILAIALSAANTIILVASALKASYVANDLLSWLIVFISIIGYVVALICLEVIARIHFSEIIRKLDDIRRLKEV